MLRKIIFTALWAMAFFYGSAMLIGLISGILFWQLASVGWEIESDGTLIKVIGTSWAVVPMASGFIGLLLAMCGKLPGTGSPHKRLVGQTP